MRLQGENIYLRTLVLSDAQTILDLENSQVAVGVSDHDGDFKLAEIQDYIRSIHDVYLDRQLRFLICNGESALGTLDLYDVDIDKNCAYVGILISDISLRRKGLGTEAMKILTDYCSQTLDIKVLKADIKEVNAESISFFRKSGFIDQSSDKGILTMQLELDNHS